jgi:hypothetical protein
MDYEFRIQLLEKETTHLREMQRMMIERQDAADARLDRLGEITQSLAESTTRLGVNIDTLGANIDTLVTKMDTFIDTLLRQPRNGH